MQKINKTTNMEIINYKNKLPHTQESWLSVAVGTLNLNSIHIRSMNNTAAEWHVHKGGDEFFMVLEGEIFIDTEKEIYKLKEKEFFIVPAGTKHRARSEGITKLLVIDNISA